MRLIKRLLVSVIPQRLLLVQTLILLVAFFFMFVGQASALIRLGDRSLLIYDPTPNATTTYKVTFGYTTPSAIGSVDMLFCIDPIPIDPCDPPPGLDVSNAVLSDQTGETGYTIDPGTHTTNHMLLTRAPTATGSGLSTYTFTGIVNPSYKAHSYSIRLADYASTDASGPIVNLGSVLTKITDSIFLESQVPPQLIFCMSHRIGFNCGAGGDGINYEDLGELSSDETLHTTSEMQVGTNASNGFVITVNGPSLSAGTHEITPLAEPTVSAPGNSQFGINLVANTNPNIGVNPSGASTNAIANPDYAISDKFTYRDGDVIASAPNVSLFRKYTISYIVNVPSNLRAGVYTTTLTYICSGRF